MSQLRQYADNAAKQRAYRARQAEARRSEQRAKGLPPAAALPTLPSHARWQALLAQARLSLQAARDEMQAYHDDRSQAWQQSERADVLLERIDSLEQALDALPPEEPVPQRRPTR
jgi:hypothetical protein